MFENLSNSQATPLPRIFYHLVVSDTVLVEQRPTLVPNYSSLPKLQHGKITRTCHWILDCGLQQSNSHCATRMCNPPTTTAPHDCANSLSHGATRLRKPPIDVHALHSLSLLVGPCRIWHVLLKVGQMRLWYQSETNGVV